CFISSMANSIYDFEVTTLEGKPVKLSAYKGKVLLIVNIASKCGYTPQLGGLEHLYETYKAQGFEVLGFPSNDFHQEPKNGDAIGEFCSRNYGVQFPVMEKGPVKGNNAQPLFNYLAENARMMGFKNYPKWNFYKYLINRNGKVVDYFVTLTDPKSAKITDSIEKCLAQKAVDN
ncbi:MAG TPA: glutathione peroxidase, partial [Chitinophagales bacterium]|nr:glutathione peroxidase [Chitinophagales bacterium]